MATKHRAIITSRFTGIKENQYIIYELILSKRLAYGHISVIVHADLSIVIVANKLMQVEEVNEIVCMQYKHIIDEINRVKNK